MKNEDKPYTPPTLTQKITNILSAIICSGLVLGVVGLVIWLALFGEKVEQPVKQASFSSAAYVACQTAIENASLAKSEVEVPFNKGQRRSDDSWEFYWGASTSPLRMPNKLGQKLILEGTCVAKEDGSVVSLVIDGNRIR